MGKTSNDKSLNVDFAALRTLRLVYENSSFSRAAETLGVKQSAVSYTIDKLRRLFADPLFVRQGAAIVGPRRCSDSYDIAVNLLDRFEMIAAPAEFDPASAQQHFSIACNYYERQLILPAVVRRLRHEAPGVTIELINSSSEGLRQLNRSEADMLIGPLRPTSGEIHGRRLLSERYACIMDAGNPLAASELTLERYLDCQHVIVTHGGNWRSGYLQQLDAMGHELRQSVSVPSPAGLQELIAGTDLFATVPRRLARV